MGKSPNINKWGGLIVLDIDKDIPSGIPCGLYHIDIGYIYSSRTPTLIINNEGRLQIKGTDFVNYRGNGVIYAKPLHAEKRSVLSIENGIVKLIDVDNNRSLDGAIIYRCKDSDWVSLKEKNNEVKKADDTTVELDSIKESMKEMLDLFKDYIKLTEKKENVYTIGDKSEYEYNIKNKQWIPRGILDRDLVESVKPDAILLQNSTILFTNNDPADLYIVSINNLGVLVTVPATTSLTKYNISFIDDVGTLYMLNPEESKLFTVKSHKL